MRTIFDRASARPASDGDVLDPVAGAFAKRNAVWVLGLLIMLAGCGGGDSEAQSGATPTETPFPPTATHAQPAEPTFEPATVTPATTTIALRSIDTATQASEGEREATTTVRPTSTPPPNPLPSNGAELRIDGRPVERIVRGDETGRTLYAISGDELMRTNDGGRSWTEGGSHATLFDPQASIAVALNEPNVLYAGDRGGCGRGLSFNDFARSTDAARTWEAVDANRDFEPLLAYEARPEAYLFATNCGLSVSADGGNTWQRIPDLAGEEVFAVATDNASPLDQILVVGATEGGTGRLFLLDTPDPTQPDLLGAIAQFWGDAAIDWHDGRIVLATSSRVGVSDNGGESWSWSRTGLEDATFSVDPLVEDIPEEELDPFRGFSTVWIDRDDPDRIWIGGVHGAYQSDDAGRTWERLGDDVQITSLVISESADRIFISTADGTRVWELDGD